MIGVGEVGLGALILAVVLSSLQSVHYVYHRWYCSSNSISIAANSRLVSLLSLLSLFALGYCFFTDQFRFDYVISHSNSQLPVFYKLAAVWGGHQGSMLFWVMTLSGWAALISFAKGWQKTFQCDVLWIMGLLVSAFGWFTLLASNPFEYASAYVTEGRDLNPMLQDIGLIFHPPLLYLGYIGYSTVLALACAALLQSPVMTNWAELARPWAISAWVFLTAGIVLGSWWAYYELGWGGWWFWDPVENASLLPWLTGTALLHALLSASKHRMFPQWAFALAFITFSLSILGTFIVRSGVLTSVHAFAVDPGKGIALLAILVVVLLCSFSLLILKSEHIKTAPIQALLSRSYVLLLALGLLSIATFTVFLGTFYPMVYELLGLGNISVGAPYFNLLITPMALLALLGIGIVPLLKWRSGCTVNRNQIITLMLTAIILGSGIYGVQVSEYSLLVWLVWCLAIWVLLTHAKLWLSAPSKTAFMVWAHIGIAVCSVGAAMNAHHSYELSRKLEPGTVTQFNDWQVTYKETQWLVGPNYTAEQGVIDFYSADTNGFTILPQRRHYPVRVMNMSEPAIKRFWHGDYYVTLGEKVSQNAYAVKLQYKAYIRWVWFGALLGMVGGVIHLTRSFKLTIRSYEAIQNS
ncbi:heme lyase CcmF/NrfE family subunit [Vibrio sp. TRT 17S01]|uniref:heme lyase CcmF/NrfE family subunit n=1 Tax=Vibrio sp. TRT 17S01 TaxID=3418505 RepID=UPI003CEBD1E2